jgi:hypothetical protein
MSTKKRKILVENISIEEIFKTFLNEKKTIIIISLAFSVFFGLMYYYAGINHVKKNQKFVSVKLLSIEEDIESMYSYYKDLLPKNFKENFRYRDKFLALDSNLADFFQQNKDKFSDFNDYFNKSNISAQDYFSKNFEKKINDYYLKYPKHLQGESLIKEFMVYQMNRFRAKLHSHVKKSILIHKNFIEKIKQINDKIYFENKKPPVKHKQLKYIQDWNIFSEKYIYVENLNYTISLSKELIKKLEDNDLIYPFSIDVKTELTSIKNKYDINSLKNFILVGLIFGFFLSLLIIFFKNLIRKDKL